jgi:hypothetical protein
VTRLQECEYGEDPPVVFGVCLDRELLEDVADVLLDGVLARTALTHPEMRGGFPAAIREAFRHGAHGPQHESADRYPSTPTAAVPVSTPS